MITLNKKYLILLIIFVACLSIACVNAQSNNQNNSNTVNGGSIDFQGFFKMSFDKDMTFKRSESMVDELGCTHGYVNDKKDVYIYYYGNDVEVGVYENRINRQITNKLHGMDAVTATIQTYQYGNLKKEGNLTILEDLAPDLGGREKYLVGVEGDSGQVVFVGGNNLNTLKTYASSVRFN